MRLALPLLVLATPALALDLAVPGELTLRETTPMGTHHLATGPARGGVVPLEAFEGPATRLIWEITQAASTTALTGRFRDQLQTDGYDVRFSCTTQACGGYDFRFGIDVAPAPAMFVDLSDFHYLTATRGDEVLSLLVTRAGAGYMAQLDLIGGTVEPLPTPDVTKSTRLDAAPNLATALMTNGVAVLEDVVFDTGSATLAGTDLASLAALAALLAANPGTAVALVGHTDAEGSLEANVRLSETRAEAVRAYLIAEFGVAESQVAAKGIGYLAPRASNLTDVGRAQNRRVEAVLIATE